jgi:hypothetical protein
MDQEFRACACLSVLRLSAGWAGEAPIRSKREFPCVRHVEIMIAEQNPGIVFILKTVAARDVQRDLKLLERSIKSIPLGTQVHVQLLP